MKPLVVDDTTVEAITKAMTDAVCDLRWGEWHREDGPHEAWLDAKAGDVGATRDDMEVALRAAMLLIAAALPDPRPTEAEVYEGYKGEVPAIGPDIWEYLRHLGCFRPEEDPRG